MNYKWLIGAILPVFLVSCGGGTKSDKVSGRPPGILFLVNGKEVADSTTISANYYIADVSTEDCGTAAVPLYDNYPQITQAGMNEYCDGTRKTINPPIVFQIGYVNSTYQPLTLNYTGLGFTIKIYQEPSGVEIWNSDAIEYMAEKIGSVTNNYDPSLTHTTTLEAQQVYPNPTSPSPYATFTFNGDQNFDSSVNPTDDNFIGGVNGNNQLALLHYDSLSDSDRSNDSSYCELTPFLDTKHWDSTTNTLVANYLNLPNGIYDKPLCQTIPLGAGTYKAVVTFNFNGDIQTRTVTINLN